MMKLKPHAVLALAAALGSAGLAMAAPAAALPAVGAQAPAFAVTTTTGQKLTLASMMGHQPLVIQFFSTY